MPARLVLQPGLVAEVQDLHVWPDQRARAVGSALLRDASRGFVDLGRRLLQLAVQPVAP